MTYLDKKELDIERGEVKNNGSREKKEQKAKAKMEMEGKKN